MKEVGYWLERGTYPLDEIAARFHHRLVAIHPFPNGKGRHGRLMADLLCGIMALSHLRGGAGTSRHQAVLAGTI
jgi:fido (protein-threonine AMPylation protein)